MALSKIKYKTLVKQPVDFGEFKNRSFFYNSTDIEKVSTQLGATGITIVNVEIVNIKRDKNGKPIEGAKESRKIHTVICAVKGTGQTKDKNNPSGYLLDPNHLIAFFCPNIVKPKDKFYIDFDKINEISEEK